MIEEQRGRVPLEKMRANLGEQARDVTPPEPEIAQALELLRTRFK
jgi:hypothetical protein